MRLDYSRKGDACNIEVCFVKLSTSTCHEARHNTRLRCIILIQAAQRGRSVRRTYSSLLVSRLEETVRFQGVWKRSIDAMLRKSSFESGGDFSWTELKHAEHDIMQADLIDDLDEFTETTQILGEAVTLVAPREGAKPCSDDEDDCREDDDKSLEHCR